VTPGDPVRREPVIGAAASTVSAAVPATPATGLMPSLGDDRLYRLLVEGVSDYAIYMLDLDGYVSSWNAGAERFKGYRAAEILGRHFSTFYTVEDRANDRPARALRIARENGRFEDTAWRLRKDGRQFWAHVVIDLIRNDDGEPMGFAKITRDISERRAADLRLRELTSSHQELEQFIHVASHDLREPLRKVLAFGDLLLDEAGERLAGHERGYVESMLSATRRMQALLASLLDLTRVTSQGQTFNPCALGGVLEDVRSDLQVRIQESGARLTVGRLPSIEADAAQMRQLFQNLIENAIKYASETRAPEIEVEAVEDKDPEMIAIECRDNGIGFEPQYAERIFGVFQRLHTRDRYDGAGIGLSVCRKICGRHRGSIVAEGFPGLGARFRIRLPRRHRPDAA
jgi:PAS domain S-box-containing protein